MQFTNKVFAVTGGGSGIGRQVVLGLLKRGARVAAADIHDNTLEETKRLVPRDMQDRLSLHPLDVTNQSAAEALPQQVIAQHGQVDGVFNVAGIIQPFVKVNDLDYAKIHQVMNVNFFGPLYLVKAFLPELLKRPEAHVVNVSSMGGFLPVPGQTVYGASKAALKLLTEGLYAELLHTQVRVTVVFPGAIATNITANSGVAAPTGAVAEDMQKKFKAMPAEKAAQIILDGVEKNKMRVLVGSDAKMMDKLYRLAPRFATNFITKQMQALLK